MLVHQITMAAPSCPIAFVAMPHPSTRQIVFMPYEPPAWAEKAKDPQMKVMRQCAKCGTSALCHCWVARRMPLNDIRLRPCVWHSDPNTRVSMAAPFAQRIWTHDCSAYAVWYEDFSCFDQCWVAEEAAAKRLNHQVQNLEAETRRLDVVYERASKFHLGYKKALAVCDTLTTQLGVTRAALKQQKRPIKDQQAEALEKVVHLDQKHLESMLANAAVLYDKRASTGVDSPVEAGGDVRAKFIEATSYVREARERLKRSKGKHENWLNKNKHAGGDAALLQLGRKEQELVGEIDKATKALTVSARAALYELYTVRKQYTNLDVSFGASRYWAVMVQNVRAYTDRYTEMLTELDRVIPIARHDDVYAEIVGERKAVAAVVAEINTKAKAEITVANTASVLGQLLIGPDGQIKSMEKDAMPALVVTASYNPNGPSLSSASVVEHDESDAVPIPAGTERWRRDRTDDDADTAHRRWSGRFG